jgi:ribosomal protein S12 methylthiotransferase
MREADSFGIPQSYYFFNLGCPKNLVDAERAAGRLDDAGWTHAAAPEDAHLLVVTTCAFIEQAEEESVEEILRVVSLKTDRQRLAVLGCLVSREGEKLQKLLPEVDLFLDVQHIDELADRIPFEGDRDDSGPASSRDSAPSQQRRPAGGKSISLDRHLFTPPHIAYLKIADGCSNCCSYCTIPDIRGSLRSRERGDLLAEAAQLIRSGVKEIVIVAQDTSAWGSERGDKGQLYDMLADVAETIDTGWLRLLYLHPAHIAVRPLAGLLGREQVCRYLDIPIQHVSDRILAGMGRGYGKRDLERLFGDLRDRIDGLVLRTTVMTGFPGETDREFGELMKFLEDTSFEHVGVFTYSPEEGTAAAGLGQMVPPEVAAERRDELLDLQMDISHEKLDARTGQEVIILVDERYDPAVRPREDIWGSGRFYGQAYEIDGMTYLGGTPVEPGRFARATLLEAEAYDIFAEIRGKLD